MHQHRLPYICTYCFGHRQNDSGHVCVSTKHVIAVCPSLACFRLLNVGDWHWNENKNVCEPLMSKTECVQWKDPQKRTSTRRVGCLLEFHNEETSQNQYHRDTDLHVCRRKCLSFCRNALRVVSFSDGFTYWLTYKPKGRKDALK